MYLYLKSHDPVLKIRVISTCKFEFSKSWEFTYKTMAYYAAENGILRDDFDKNSIKKTKLNPPNSESRQLAFTLENVLTAEECKQLIEGSERIGYTEALINIGANQDIFDTRYRKSSRFMIDDKQFVSKLWSRICDQIPDTFKSHKVCGLNKRLRFLRYDSEDFFKPHVIQDLTARN